MNTYLKSIYVHNNYVNNNFLIDFTPQNGEKFKHLIITGENGSGKTTILKSLAIKSMLYQHDLLLKKEGFTDFLIKNKNNELLKDLYNLGFPKIELEYIKKNSSNENKKSFSIKEAMSKNSNIDKLKSIFIYIPTLKYQLVNENFNGKKVGFNIKISEFINKFTRFALPFKNLEYEVDDLILDVVSNFDGLKKSLQENDSNSLKSYTKKTKNAFKNLEQFKRTNPYENLEEIPRLSLTENFLDFLAFLKDEQIYAIGDNEIEKAEALTKRFLDLEKAFQKLFEEPKLKLIHRFNRGDRTFYFEYPDGRQTNFNQLSHGHNAVMTMLAEIMLNIEAYREENPDDVNPKGIVVIDEIESHLHLSLQEKILPVLIQMFPNIQFIVATHSPAVIASIDNVTIYDLSKQRTVNENITGIPYNVLMKEHFGLESDYSITVTQKLERATEMINKNALNKEETEELEKSVNELQKLSPKLALDIYLEIERRKRND